MDDLPAKLTHIVHARRLLPGPTGCGTEGGTARVPQATTHAACAYELLLLRHMSSNFHVQLESAVCVSLGRWSLQ